MVNKLEVTAGKVASQSRWDLKFFRTALTFVNRLACVLFQVVGEVPSILLVGREAKQVRIEASRVAVLVERNFLVIDFLFSNRPYRGSPVISH